MGIRVITLEGGQASLSQYLLRWVFRLADFPVWIFGAICNRLAVPGTAAYWHFQELPVLSYLINPSGLGILSQVQSLFSPDPELPGRILFLPKSKLVINPVIRR